MNKRVFVIGAGAHVDFGMPTGFQLTESLLICQNILSKNPNAFYENQGFRTFLKSEISKIKYVDTFTLDRLEFSLGKIHSDIQNLSFLDKGEISVFFLEFIRLFHQSGQSSIDSFLSEQDLKLRHSEKFFKGFLGLIIQGMQLFAMQNHYKPNWIRRLLSKLTVDTLVNNELIAFITFNYDTILEDMIYDFFKAQHAMSHEEAIENLRKIEIIHVYGRVPSLHTSKIQPEKMNYQDREISSERPDYSLIKANKDIDIVRNPTNISSKIGLLSEMTKTQRSKTKDDTSAKLNVAFLGFGFDSVNTNILLNNMPEASRPDHWLTTKMSQAQFSNALDLVQPNTHNLKSPLSLGLTVEDVLFDSDFLRF